MPLQIAPRGPVGIADRPRRVRAGMRPDEMSEQITTRAEPLPEERRAEQGGEDRRAEAAEILRDSEERVAEAADGAAPSDAAKENRPSEETAGQ